MVFIKKLPKIYQNSIDKKINNNKSIYYSNDEAKKSMPTMNKDDIELFLEELFNSTRYVFNIPVMIVTKDKKYETGIIMRNGSMLLTLDRDKIPISDIVSIKRKNP